MDAVNGICMSTRANSEAVGTPTFLWHPAASIFPMLPEDKLLELADDIEKNGQREAILILDGKILDGRNRSCACQLKGIRLVTKIVTDIDDPVAYVLSLNLHRRHLTPSQASMCAARARELYEQQAKERMLSGKKSDPVENLPQGESSKARDAAGKAFGVSGKSVDFAKKVLDKGIPELAKAVDEGRMAVSTAAVLASQPEDKQKDAIESQSSRSQLKCKKPDPSKEESSPSLTWPEALKSASRKKQILSKEVAEMLGVELPDVRKSLSVMDKAFGYQVRRLNNDGLFSITKAPTDADAIVETFETLSPKEKMALLRRLNADSDVMRIKSEKQKQEMSNGYQESAIEGASNFITQAANELHKYQTNFGADFRWLPGAMRTTEGVAEVMSMIGRLDRIAIDSVAYHKTLNERTKDV